MCTLWLHKSKLTNSWHIPSCKDVSLILKIYAGEKHLNFFSVNMSRANKHLKLLPVVQFWAHLAKLTARINQITALSLGLVLGPSHSNERNSISQCNVAHKGRSPLERSVLHLRSSQESESKQQNITQSSNASHHIVKQHNDNK